MQIHKIMQRKHMAKGAREWSTVKTVSSRLSVADMVRAVYVCGCVRASS